MRIQKRGLGILVAVLLMFSVVPITAQAAAPVGIMPLWTNTFSASASLQISSGTASCSGSVIGFSGTTRITATFTLERKNTNGTFSAVKTWSGLSSNSATLTFSGTHTVSSGTYRLKGTAVVTRNGTSETVTAESAERTV